MKLIIAQSILTLLGLAIVFFLIACAGAIWSPKRRNGMLDSFKAGILPVACFTAAVAIIVWSFGVVTGVWL